MSTFVDGPAAGQTLMNQRQPKFLRIVTAGNHVDCLDQLEDEARPDEAIAVYELIEVGAAALVRLARPATCVTMWTGVYRHLPEIDGEAMRENEAWQAWARAQAVPA